MNDRLQTISLHLNSPLSRIVSKYDYYFFRNIDFILSRENINNRSRRISYGEITTEFDEDKDLYPSHFIELPDRRWLFLFSNEADSLLIVYDLKTNQRTILDKHRTVRSDLKFINNRIVCPSNDFVLKVWSSETLELIHILQGHTDMIEKIGGLSDGRIVSVSRDTTARIWNLESGDCEYVFTQHQYEIYHLFITKDDTIITYSLGKLYVWKPNGCILSITDWVIYSYITFLSDESLFSSNNDRLIIFNPKTLITKTKLFDKNIRAQIELLDNTILISTDTSLEIWDTDLNIIISKEYPYRSEIMFLFPNNYVGIVTNDEDIMNVHIIDPETLSIHKTIRNITGYGVNIPSALKDGRVLTTRREDNIVVWS